MRIHKGDPQFGPVCECGGPKAKQAKTCQQCHGKIRGYNSVPIEVQRRRWRGVFTAPAVGRENSEDRRKQLAAARLSVSGELAELAAQQERDERLGHFSGDRWMLSLDSLDEFGRQMYERVPS